MTIKYKSSKCIDVSYLLPKSVMTDRILNKKITHNEKQLPNINHCSDIFILQVRNVNHVKLKATLYS